jgi:putative DeoR family transcriptional regulator (stage III sporulation protein D)
MKQDADERAVRLGEYVTEHGATVRAAAAVFGCSKSTVYKDLTERLRRLDPALAGRARKILDVNKAERHLRGGQATREKYGRKNTNTKNAQA